MTHHAKLDRLEMKPGQAVLLSFAVIAACLLSYEFFDAPAARFCASLNYKVKEIFGLITWLGISTPWVVGALAGFIYFKFIKKRNPGKCGRFPARGRDLLGTGERPGKDADWQKQARIAPFRGHIRV